MRTLALVLSVGCCFPVAIVAQSERAAATSAAHKAPVPTATAVRRVGPVVLDARLDEPAWKVAPPITEFTQVDPEEGKPASQRTEVRFLYDDDALYVGAKMFDTDGGAGGMTRLVRRDANFDSDYFEIVIDGYHDHLSRAFFDVNPSGSRADQIGIGTSCCDASWDPVWETATHIDADGWTAEIRIPFSQLRFSRDSVQTWGLQVRRFIKRRNEQDQWSFWHKTDAGGPPRFGHLQGIRIQRASSGLELLPYVVGRSSAIASSSPGNPFNTHGRPTMRAGLDLKDRVTSNLTLDATFNPDFGQVEVDPAVLNLSAFETSFQEKRPFFIEGAQVFDVGGNNCFFCSNTEPMSSFYSRRIGRAPTGADLALANFAYADVPDATTILGAGKLTGRTASGTTVGLLDAVTGQANARVATPGGSRLSQEVEPLANYFVGRLKQDFLDGNFVVGGMLSGVARNIDTTFAPRLARHAEDYGTDLFYTWAERTFSFRAQAALTNVSGDPREILLREQSSARYFQRPDRGAGTGGFLSNRLDSSATALRGAGWYARIAKETGNWLAELQTNGRTPGYETNDYAFQQRADYLWYNGNVARTWTTPTRWYRQIFTIAGGQLQNNFEGDRTQAQLHAYWSELTPQFWNVATFYINRPAAIDDRQLRGGPAVRTPAGQFAQADVSSDSRAALIGNGSISHYWDGKGDISTSLSTSATYRPAPNVSMTFGPSWSNARNYAQYVQAVPDPTATAFAGTRYVMSNLDQTTLALDSRLSLTFSPRMTLELYAQPFFASGQYVDFKEYVAPRTAETAAYGRDRGTITATRDAHGLITQYTIDPDGAGPAKPFTLGNPNFSQQSLRGNAVFRWEYRPGSVLYVAWTQTRFAGAAFGDLQLDRDRAALMTAKPDDIFLVKASWWLPR